MNPNSIRRFLTSRFGLFVIFIVVTFTGLAVYGRYRRGHRTALPINPRPSAPVGQMQARLDRGLENRMPQAAGTLDSDIVPLEQSKVAPARTDKPARPRKVHIAPLVAGYELAAEAPPRPVAAVRTRIVPFGTLLKCKLVNTVDSSDLDTPVIAVLLEDVWQNGMKVLPANTLLHGMAKSGRTRDRIAVGGTWRLVWQDGRELAFSGLALDREYDHDINGYGITDGSAGLRGHILAADGLQDLKMLAAAAMSGFARGTQDQTQTAFGTTITGSVSNSVRQGVGEVFDAYARRTLRDIEQNGYFVRVPAGKEFYVYVLEPINTAEASVAPSSTETRNPATSTEMVRAKQK